MTGALEASIVATVPKVVEVLDGALCSVLVAGAAVSLTTCLSDAGVVSLTKFELGGPVPPRTTAILM